MNDVVCRGFSTEQNQAIDHLYGLLLDSMDFNHFLSVSLEWISAQLNRQCGMFYLVYPNFENISEWVKFNVPDSWNHQIFDLQSPLLQEIRKVYISQMPSNAISSLQISAILPLSSKEPLGVLILGGEPLEDEKKQYAHFLLFELGRLLFAQLHTCNQWMEEKEKLIHQAISASVNVLISDPNQTLFKIMQDLRADFVAENLLLIQRDADTPNLFSRKLLGDSDDWIDQENILISSDVIDRLFASGNSVDQITCSEVITLIPEIINPNDKNPRRIIFTPIQSLTENSMGAILLINPQKRIGLHEQKLLLEVGTLLADYLKNVYLQQKMKINLAKLEARHIELLNSRNNLRTMFDNIPNSIYIVDTSYKIQIINNIRSSRLNKKPNNLVGKTCYEVLFDRKSPCTACKVGETWRDGQITNRVWREWTSSETYLDWEIHTYPIYDEMHFPVQAIIFEEDITEKRNLEANLIQSEKLAAVGQLAAGIAHEINNPLAAIIANAQILLQETPKENVDGIESLKLIETAGIRASQVVRNLLSISRKEMLDFEPIDINTSVKNALTLIQHELIKRPIRVIPELAANLPPILAQQDHLQGVWINLMMNAVDAISSTDRSDGLLIVKTWSSDTEIHVSISDNGSGIEPEKVKKVFEPFYTTKSTGRGTGLGLSVCMRVIKEHQGNISVESQPGQGTRFLISLPISVNNVSD